MTLYAGQTNSYVKPLESEKNLMLFDEKTRREAYFLINDKSEVKNQPSPELVTKLIQMSIDGSHQASYFLGAFVTEGLIPNHLPEDYQESKEQSLLCIQKFAEVMQGPVLRVKNTKK